MAHLGAFQSYIVTTPPPPKPLMFFPLLDTFLSWKRAEYFALVAIV